MVRCLRRRRLVCCWIGDLLREGGCTSVRKTVRVLRSLKRVLKNIRVDMDWVLSIGLGLKPKSFVA
jgi:hypothetical protein